MTLIDEKQTLRRQLRRARREHVAGLDPLTRALILRVPPSPIAALIASDDVVGFYIPTADEAPTHNYAAWAFERGHRLALPWFADREGQMQFRSWSVPLVEDTDVLTQGPFCLQPFADAEPLVPTVVFMPLVGFSANGDRLGQGGGHYDRWLAAHPETTAIGLAWDVQEVPELPREAHDIPLAAVVTPTRLFGPFDR